jgi:NADPH-dependent ferric siderophore reductase
MASSNIAVAHAASGLMHAEVVRTARVSPHLVRVTVGGDDLRRFAFQGFDQWVRLALPPAGRDRVEGLGDRLDVRGYLQWRTVPAARRPVIRNYTIRSFDADALEADIDFVVHGDAGVAGPWAVAAAPGAGLAMIDQGCGFRHDPSIDRVLLVGDETAMPAIAGILRDLPRDTVGEAVIEVPDIADAQEAGEPDGVGVHWVVRPAGARPGALALEHALELPPADGAVQVFAAGESALATGVRRRLVERGVPKGAITFCGYWKLGRAG